MKKLAVVVLLLLVSLFGRAQFFDLNLFKPRLVLEGEYMHNTSDSSLSYWNSGFNFMFPIKNKIEFKVDWGKAIFSGSIKEAIQHVRPKAYQIFGNVGGSFQQFGQPANLGDFQLIKGGVSGIYATIKNKKLRTLLFASSVRITQTPQQLNNIGVNPSIFAGTAIANSLKSFWILGGYGSYFGKRVIATPVVGHYYKFNKKWSSLLILPAQAKLSYKINKKYEQSIAASFMGDNFRLQKIDNGLMHKSTFFQTGIRFSTQAKIKIKRCHLYLEAGWQEFSRSGEVSGYQNIGVTQHDGSLFSKLRLNIPFNKSLLNTDTFDFGL